MKRLVVNADDFGMTDGVCRGIIRAVREGAVTAATAMTRVPGGLERLARFAPAIPGRIGLHFQLTSGVPCLPPEEIPSLIGSDGLFPKKRKLVGEVDPHEVEREWRAQIACFLGAGLRPTHLDSHHHIHRLPGAFPVFCKLAQELDLPGRAVDAAMAVEFRARGVKYAGECLTGWFGEDVSAGRFLELVDEAFAKSGGQGVFEVMTHPAEVDDDLRAISSYVDERGLEFASLTSHELLEGLRAMDVTLVSPSGLFP